MADPLTLACIARLSELLELLKLEVDAERASSLLVELDTADDEAASPLPLACEVVPLERGAVAVVLLMLGPLLEVGTPTTLNTLLADSLLVNKVPVLVFRQPRPEAVESEVVVENAEDLVADVGADSSSGNTIRLLGLLDEEACKASDTATDWKDTSCVERELELTELPWSRFEEILFDSRTDEVSVLAELVCTACDVLVKAVVVVCTVTELPADVLMPRPAVVTCWTPEVVEEVLDSWFELLDWEVVYKILDLSFRLVLGRSPSLDMAIERLDVEIIDSERLAALSEVLTTDDAVVDDELDFAEVELEKLPDLLVNAKTEADVDNEVDLADAELGRLLTRVEEDFENGNELDVFDVSAEVREPRRCC